MKLEQRSGVVEFNDNEVTVTLDLRQSKKFHNAPFETESIEFRQADYSIAYFDQNSFDTFFIEKDTIYIYRGWMITEKDYSKLYNKVKDKGGVLFHSPNEYIHSTSLSFWYPYFKTVTFQTRMLSDVKALPQEKFFIRDDYKIVLKYLERKGQKTRAFVVTG